MLRGLATARLCFLIPFVGTSGQAPAAPELDKQFAVLLFTDIVGSVEMQKKLGTAEYTQVVARHDQLIKEAFRDQHPPPVILNETGDGILAKFATPSDAVSAALRIQYLFSAENWEPAPVRLRIGLHSGEITEMAEEISGDTRVVGMAVNLAARVMDLANGGQILMTRGVFDDARQFISAHPQVGGLEDVGLPILQWPAHGRYLFKGHDEPMDIFEVGAEGIAPLRPPEGSAKAKRAVAADEEDTLGWRPGAGLEIPRRTDWVVVRKVGEGGFGEVWLAQHKTTKEQRVFKFCFDPERLRSFKRELTLFRLLRDTVGKRDDIAALHDVSVEAPPYYLESEWVPTGNLSQWAETQGGMDKVPLATRLDFFVRTAKAVSAAHSVGIIHKDIKPSNVLVVLEGDQPQPRLADFGIGTLYSDKHLEEMGITQMGFTQSLVAENESSRTGTRIYSAPEYIVGAPASVRGDVYSLGVMLYQLAAGDINKPLGSGWERDIEDELLREDIASAIDIDPERRFESAQHLAEQIESIPERRAAAAAQQARDHQAARRKKLLVLTTVGLGVFALAAGFLSYAFVQQRKALAHQKELEAKTRAFASDLEIRLAGQSLELRDGSLAVAHLVRALRNTPDNELAARALLATVAHSNFMTPTRTPIRAEQGGAYTYELSPDGSKVAAWRSEWNKNHYWSGAADQKVMVWDLERGISLTPEILSRSRNRQVYDFRHQASGSTQELPWAYFTNDDSYKTVFGKWDDLTPIEKEEAIYKTIMEKGGGFDGGGIEVDSLTFQTWDLRTGEMIDEVTDLVPIDQALAITLSYDESRILARDESGRLEVLDRRTGKPLSRQFVPPDRSPDLAEDTPDILRRERQVLRWIVGPEGRWIVAQTRGTVLEPDLYCYDLTSTDEQEPWVKIATTQGGFANEYGDVCAFAVSANKNRIAAFYNGMDNSMALGVWSIPEGERMLFIEERGSWYNRLALSPDGRLLVAASGADAFVFSVREKRAGRGGIVPCGRCRSDHFCSRWADCNGDPRRHRSNLG